MSPFDTDLDVSILYRPGCLHFIQAWMSPFDIDLGVYT